MNPNELVAPYDDRMPIVLDDAHKWLDTETTLDDITRLARMSSWCARSTAR